MDEKTSLPSLLSPSPFRSLLKRHMQANPYAGIVTLATVENGRPRARTVLFQGLAERADGSIGICIKTHSESNKKAKVDSPAVEIVWWMESTSVQFRFAGDISYTDEEQRQRVWKSLNQGAKSQFFYNVAAGLDSSTQGPLFAQERKQAREQGFANPPRSFVVGVLMPQQVDFLDLTTLQRINWTVNEQGSWTEKKGFAPPVVSTAT